MTYHLRKHGALHPQSAGGLTHNGPQPNGEAEAIAARLYERTREQFTRKRPQPSAPRRFSWEREPTT